MRGEFEFVHEGVKKEVRWKRPQLVGHRGRLHKVILSGSLVFGI